MMTEHFGKGSRFAEIDLYPGVLKLFSKHPHAYVEVPYQRKRVDLVFSSRGMKFLYAVEVKVLDWRSAVRQAALNQLFAQFSYVALPEVIVSRFDDCHKRMFTKYRLGLISVANTRATIEIKAFRNGLFHLPHHKAVKGILRAANSSIAPKELGILTHAITNRSRTLDLLQAWPHERKRTVQAQT
jgi:hypothetical protein